MQCMHYELASWEYHAQEAMRFVYQYAEAYEDKSRTPQIGLCAYDGGRVSKLGISLQRVKEVQKGQIPCSNHI